MITPGFPRMTMRTNGAFLRRAVAICCALMFLVVGFAHTLQHVDSPITAAALYVDGAPSTDVSGGDDAGKVLIIAEHCHECSIVTLALIAPSIVCERVGLVVSRPPETSRPYQAVADTPPPKSVV